MPTDPPAPMQGEGNAGISLVAVDLSQLTAAAVRNWLTAKVAEVVLVDCHTTPPLALRLGEAGIKDPRLTILRLDQGDVTWTQAFNIGLKAGWVLMEPKSIGKRGRALARGSDFRFFANPSRPKAARHDRLWVLSGSTRLGSQPQPPLQHGSFAAETGQSDAAVQHLPYESALNWTAAAHQDIEHWRKRSHFQYFLPRLDQLIAQGLANTVFLATDTPAVHAEFASRYGSRVTWLPRPSSDRASSGVRAG